ncbi:exodeoxyribonuclease VII large subunit [Cognatishimia maritima]|uniref:Exodeoxyribonuclease 7 large subunit n=1 Tax=Cognatishimia maritima TaxID=870908 RepID=A0A1M5KSJ9_9RHOB|nr:exodeoxyribonuclease VII large subunit [Cognatishimia maritima]SHG55751.1 Exodeoxyribonuclease VII large subunit [Cognatishimia maritima]
MSELFDDPREGENAPEFSVSELSGAIKKVIEGNFGHVRIRAEIGRVSFPRSGHVYLDLKDDKSVIAGVMWKGVASKLPMRPEEGMEVVATGRITTFGGQSKYQIVIEDMKPAGVGALMAMLEKRKAQLSAEGLFDPARKKPLPMLPEVIGVVTSPSGAVIRDILHRLRDRFPRKVLIWPVAVQGEKCAPEVARGIEGFNKLSPGGALPRPDLIIVARGGGSVEDLWGFNEESVVRAAAASEIPLISAVGHETDTTLIDFASDRRAPTPTAAAELAVPVRLEMLAWVDEQGARMTRALEQGVSQRGQRLRDLTRAMPKAETLLDTPRQRLDRASDALPRALRAAVDTRRLRLTDKAAGLRPNNLRRMIDGKRSEFGRRADRLSVTPIKRDIERKSDKVTSVTHRFKSSAEAQIKAWSTKLDGLERLRQTLGYEATLERGYAVVWDGDEVVTSTKEAAQASELAIQFADGRHAVAGGREVKPASKPAKKAPKTKQTPPDQGSLF